MNSLLDWLDNRTGYKALLHEALYERIPGGARWRYVWGSTLVFTFSVQMITGFFLWTAYSPSAQTAWESVYYIQHHMTMGWFVRGLHHFCAQAMVVLMALHLMQVIIDGAYKAPREVNFWLGLVLMQIVLGLSLTGYLLPWDQKGYYATQVATEIAGATPIIGPWLQKIAQGGAQYGHHTLTRFFALHTGLLPGALVAFLALHIYVFRRHGITVPDPNRAPEAMFWPEQVFKDAFACLVVLTTCGVLAAYFHGAEMSAPANPAEAYSAARPEWYFLFLFRFLKYEWVEHISNGPAFGAIYVPGAIMTILFLMPLIAKLKAGHKFNVAFIWLIAIGAAGLTVVAMNEDKKDASFQAAVKEAVHDGERHAELASAYGIPEGGAIKLGQTDPAIRGPRIFAQSCAACHRFDSHNGRGFPVMITEGKKKVEAPATATDLGHFGGREWMKGVLTDFPKQFAALKNEASYTDRLAKKEKGETVAVIDVDKGGMAEWSKDNGPTLLKPENAEDLNALIEFLVSQGARTHAAYDPKLVARGKEIFETGKLKAGEITTCTNCHDLKADKPFAEAEESPDSAPSLTGYGSAAWLKAFINNPGGHLQYGASNTMPAYDKILTPEEVDLLVRWMVGDYYKP